MQFLQAGSGGLASDLCWRRELSEHTLEHQLTRGSRSFPQSLQGNVAAVTWNTPRPLPSTSFQILHLLIILSFDAV
jgi:hypothetical protein